MAVVNIGSQFVVRAGSEYPDVVGTIPRSHVSYELGSPWSRVSRKVMYNVEKLCGSHGSECPERLYAML